MSKTLKPLLKCHYCRARMSPTNATKDHVVPLSRGGKARDWNTVPSCSECNTKKDNRWPSRHCPECVIIIDKHAALGITEDAEEGTYIPPTGKRAIRRARAARTSYTAKSVRSASNELP